MVMRKTNPVGLDALIDKMQVKLYEDLSVLWDVELAVYPRCYINIREAEGGTVKTIEHFAGNEDYINLIHAEGNKCFFVQTGEDRPRDNVRYETTIELYFTVNFDEVKPGLTHRADSEVHTDVLDVIKKIPDTSINRIVTQIQRVYSGFAYRETDDNQPYHCFKIEMEVIYDPKTKNCS